MILNGCPSQDLVSLVDIPITQLAKDEIHPSINRMQGNNILYSFKWSDRKLGTLNFLISFDSLIENRTEFLKLGEKFRHDNQ